MKDRVKTLVLYANGYGWRSVLADTVRHACGVRPDADPPAFWRPFRRTWPVTRFLDWKTRYGDLSYVVDWLAAFQSAPGLDVDTCNINSLLEFSGRRRAIKDYSLVVILHSASGDSMSVLLWAASWFQGRKGKLFMFIGNEYSLMDQKLAFIRSAQPDFVCTQLPIDSARRMYQEFQTSLLEMPHALNPALYRDLGLPRVIDIGFVGALYDRFIGDRERTELILRVKENAPDWGLRADIRTRNLPREEWAFFLNQCQAVVGAESGTYYLDQKGEAIARARAYLENNPEASFEDVYNWAFAGRAAFFSGKSISSRHFEPIGAKTCQILIEGDYNGILRAGEHYIAVRKDLENLPEAIRQFRDGDYRKGIVERAYQHVMDSHTYSHRVDRLVEAAGF